MKISQLAWIVALGARVLAAPVPLPLPEACAADGSLPEACAGAVDVVKSVARSPEACAADGLLPEACAGAVRYTHE